MALQCPLRACGATSPAVSCYASAAWSHQSSGVRRRGHISRASAAGDGTAGKLPVVDDAIPLPPPATGSQYAWRRSWGGSSSSSTGGGGSGGSGRSWQARTRDWGRGPNGSILFVILYRMRLLLLYGVWVTVLYGAFRAVADLTTAAGRAGYSLVSKAGQLLYGSGSSSSSSAVEPEAGAAGDVVSCAAVDGTGTVHDGTGSASEGAADGEAAPGAGSPNSSSSSSSSFPGAAASRLRNRPTVTVFENLMSAVIPLYLMLLGSVVFFASM